MQTTHQYGLQCRITHGLISFLAVHSGQVVLPYLHDESSDDLRPRSKIIEKAGFKIIFVFYNELQWLEFGYLLKVHYKVYFQNLQFYIHVSLN